MSTPVFIIHTDSKVIPLKQTERFIQLDSHVVVVRTKKISQRLFSWIVTIIDFMVSPIIEQAQGPAHLTLIIFQCHRSCSTQNIHFIVYNRLKCFTRILKLRFGKAYITCHLIMLIESIS